MHSNSHPGISLAAMTHVASTLPNLDHRAVQVPTGPGLGVELDHDALERLHRRYLDSGLRGRDDAGYMRRFHPEYALRLPRW
ncbi:hypothetical protein GCM10010317_050000 [Streptomyces mirabilis]|nr:hypothetical protein GCM10010317_050000 [Streptomyces mirabilis]